MFIRCKSCHGPVWLDNEQAAKFATATCKICGQHYEVEGVTGRAGRDLAVAARRFANERQVDLPGAYSVLLKIIDFECLREVGRSDAPDAGAAPRARQQDVDFDPAFQGAVDAGLLTPRQAMERGDRERYASTVAQRHGLSLEAGCAIADNRMSLLEALRTRKAPEDGPLRVSVARPPLTRIGWAATAVLLIAAVFAIQRALHPGDSSDTMNSRRIGGVDVRTDAHGRVVQVSGADPRSVLRTFCVVGDRPFHAVATVPSSLHGARVRLGLLHDPSDESTLLAIPIREDQGSKGWVAGNGNTPLVAEPAPRGVVEAMRQKPRQGGESRDASPGEPLAKDP